MARIPMGDFGNALPQVQPTQLPQSNINELAGALGNVSNTIGQINQQKDQEQRQLEVTNKMVELSSFKNDSDKAQLDIDNALSTQFNDTYADIKSRVANGSLNAQQAKDELITKSNDIYKGLETNIPMAMRQDMRNYWDQNVNKSSGSFAPLQIRADENMQQVNLDRASQVYGRFVDRKDGLDKFNAYVDRLIIPEAQKVEAKNKFAATQEYNQVQDEITTATANGDIAALDKVITGLGDKTYLTEDKVQDIRKHVLSVKTSIQNKNDAEERRRISESGKILNDFETQVRSGLPLDDKYIANARQAVSGTPNEGEFNFYYAHYEKIQNFTKMSTADQLTEINHFKTQLKDTKTSNPADAQKLLNVYESLYDQKKKTYNNDPNQAASENGLKVYDVKGLELKTSPNSFIDKVVHNGINQIALRSKDGNVKIAPISPAALPDAQREFNAMGVTQKLNFIGGLIQKTKGVTDGNKLWGAVLGQLSGGDQNYTAAALAQMNGYKSTEGRSVATAIVTGSQLLKNKGFYMPKEDDLHRYFNEQVGQTVSGTTANNMYNVFRSIYADTINSLGELHNGKDESINKSAAHTAVSLATGGIYTQDGKFRNYMDGKIKDWKVTKPYGMTDAKFEAALEKGYAGVSHYTKIPVADLKGYRLYQSSKRTAQNEIQYDLIDERGNPLTKNGHIWRIRIQRSSY